MGSSPTEATKNKFVYVKYFLYICRMKYEITIERKKRDVVIEVKTKIIESNRKPQIGEGRALLSEPPIFETIIAVKEIKEDEKTRRI